MALPPPITISDAAASRVQELLFARGKESVGIRVGVRKGGCSGLAYTIEYADDVQKFEEVIKEKDVTVLIDPVIVADSSSALMDVDVVDAFSSIRDAK